MIRVSPSALSADFANLGQELREIEAAGADMIHADIMDGVYVPNLSFGLPVVKAMRRATGLFMDVHLMISKPMPYIDAFADAGADLITFHVEQQPALCGDIIRKIKARGVKAGISLEPATPIERLLPYLPDLDLVLVMTVRPGFGGQKFMADMCPKLDAVRAEQKRIGKEELILQVDGGINGETAAICAAHGADCFVAGSSVFDAPDYKAAIAAIRTGAQGAF